MEGKIFKQSLLNLPVAADVDTSSVAGQILITGLLSIETGKLVSISEVVAVAETVQVASVGSVTAPTIVAGCRYTVKLGNTATRREGAQSQLFPYSYVAPTTLSGDADTDRMRAYNTLASRINERSTNNVQAYSVITITHAAGAFVIGEILTGATTSATGRVLASPSGTTTEVGMISGEFSATENVDDETGSGPFLASAIAEGEELRIIDDAGYYPVNGNRSRNGASTVVLADKFDQTLHLVITTAAVYEEGQGAKLLAMVQINELTSDNLASGVYGFPENEAPVTGEEYTRFIIRDVLNNTGGVPNGVDANTERFQVVYADDDAAGYAAFRAALNALSAIVTL